MKSKFKKILCSGLAGLSLMSTFIVPMKYNAKPQIVIADSDQDINYTRDVHINKEIIKKILKEEKKLKKSDKNGMTTLLLAIFGGPLGLHRFYAGKVGTGMLYLFTGGLFSIGWIMDIISIACGNFKDSENRKIKL